MRYIRREQERRSPISAQRIRERQARTVEQEQQRRREEYKRQAETSSIIQKYGIDIRKYQADPNYSINVSGGKIVSIVPKKQSYNSAVNERFYDTKPTTKNIESNMYAPEKIIFKDGRAVRKEYYVIDKSNYEHEKNDRGIYARSIDYSPRLSKIEFYDNQGRVIKEDSYSLREDDRRKGSSSLGIRYEAYKSGTKDFVRGIQETFRPKPARVRSYKDRVKVVEVVAGKTRTVSRSKDRLKAGDRYLSETGKLTTYTPTKWKESDVKNILEKTGQIKESKDKTLISEILKSKSLQDQLVKKVSGVYTEEAKFLQAKKQFLTKDMFDKYFSGKFVNKIPFEIYKSYKEMGVDLTKEPTSTVDRAIKIYVNNQNIKNTLLAKQQTARDKDRVDQVGKWKYLESSVKTSKQIKDKNKQKQLLREAKLAMISPDGLLQLRNKTLREQQTKLFNKYYKDKNVSFYAPKTKKFYIRQVVLQPDGSYKIVKITGDMLKGKTIRREDYKSYIQVLKRRVPDELRPATKEITELFTEIKKGTKNSAKIKKELADVLNVGSYILSKTYVGEILSGLKKNIISLTEVPRLIQSKYRIDQEVKKYNKVQDIIIKSVKARGYITETELKILENNLKRYNKNKRDYTKIYREGSKDFYSADAKLARNFAIMVAAFILLKGASAKMISSKSLISKFTGKVLGGTLTTAGVLGGAAYVGTTTLNLIKNPSLGNIVKFGEMSTFSIVAFSKAIKGKLKKQTLSGLQRTRNKLYKKYEKETNPVKIKKIEDAIVKTEAMIVQFDKNLNVKQLDGRIKSIRKQIQKRKIPELQRQIQRKELKVLTSKQKNLIKAEKLLKGNAKQVVLSKRGISDVNKYLERRNKIFELIDGTLSTKETSSILNTVKKQDVTFLKNIRKNILKSKTKLTKTKWIDIFNASKELIIKNRMLTSKKAQVRAKGKRKTTKAQLSKNSLNQAYDPRITRTKDAIYIKDKATKEYTSFLQGRKGERVKVRKGKVEFKEEPTRRGEALRTQRILVAKKQPIGYTFEKATRILEPTRTKQKKLYQPGRDSQSVERKRMTQRNVEFTSSILDKSSGRADILFKQKSVLKGKPLKISFEKRVAKTKNIKNIQTDKNILVQDLKKGKISKPSNVRPVLEQINRNNISSSKGFRSSRSRNQLYERLNKLKEQRRKEINKAKQKSTAYQKQFIKKSPYKYYKYAFNKQTDSPMIYWSKDKFGFLKKGDISFGFLTRKNVPYYYSVEKVQTPSKEVMTRIFGDKGRLLFKDYVNVVAVQPLGTDNLLMSKQVAGDFIKGTNQNFNDLLDNSFKYGFDMKNRNISRTNIDSRFISSQLKGSKIITASLINNALLYGREILSVSKSEFNNLMKKDIKKDLKLKTRLRTKQVKAKTVKKIKKPVKPKRTTTRRPKRTVTRPSKIKPIISRTRITKPSKPKSPTTKTPKPVPLKLPRLETIKETRKELNKTKKIDVYIKKLGAKTKYQRVNNGYLTPVDAVKFARYITDNFKFASYVYKPSKLKRRQKFNISTPAYKFRGVKKTSKLPKTAKIEKRKYRIDKTGEKLDITAKGIRKLRKQQSIVKLTKKKAVKRRKPVKSTTVKRKTTVKKKPVRKKATKKKR